MSRYIHARLTPGQDDDLIVWLDGLPGGERSDLVRHALRLGIGLLAAPANDDERLVALVRQAVAEALAGMQVVVAKYESPPGAEDLESRFGARLDRLLDGLSASGSGQNDAERNDNHE